MALNTMGLKGLTVLSTQTTTPCLKKSSRLSILCNFVKH